MNKMPLKLRSNCSSDPFYWVCARREALRDHECQADPLTGRLVEWEHALVFAGRQIQEKFAIVPLCWYVHRGPALNKEINVWIALSRATSFELFKYSKAVNLRRTLENLKAKYGHFKMPTPEPTINY